MKITKVDAIQIEDKPADQPGWRPIVCRVYTDTGLYGDGEAAIAYGVGSTAAYGMIQDLAKLIIGMNLFGKNYINRLSGHKMGDRLYLQEFLH